MAANDGSAEIEEISAEQDTTVGTHLGDGENALSSPLLPPKNKRAITGESSVEVVGARA